MDDTYVLIWVRRLLKKIFWNCWKTWELMHGDFFRTWKNVKASDDKINKS